MRRSRRNRRNNDPTGPFYPWNPTYYPFPLPSMEDYTSHHTDDSYPIVGGPFLPEEYYDAVDWQGERDLSDEEYFYNKGFIDALTLVRQLRRCEP